MLARPVRLAFPRAAALGGGGNVALAVASKRRRRVAKETVVWFLTVVSESHADCSLPARSSRLATAAKVGAVLASGRCQGDSGPWWLRW